MINWPQAVIFDLDGTLVDSAPDIAVALNKTFAESNFATFSLQEVRMMIGGGALKLIERALKSLSIPLDDTLTSGLLNRFIEIYAAAAVVETTPYPNVRETITALKQEGRKIGLCTNKPHEITHIVLDAFKLTDLFDGVIGLQPQFKRKPDPGSLRHLMSEMNITADQALLIGDSGADVGLARAVDMPVYIMSYGYSKVPPGELGADGVLDDLMDVVTMLQEGALTAN